MALVAKMQAVEVLQMGGGRWVPCEPTDEGAVAMDDPSSPVANLYTDPPSWLTSSTHVRRLEQAQSAEAVKLSAVSRPKGSDPDQTNAQWAMASPSGTLTLTIHNPKAFGQIKPGREYRVTIEEVRSKRNRGTGPIRVATQKVAAGQSEGYVVHDDSTTFSVDPDGTLYLWADLGDPPKHVYRPGEWFWSGEDDGSGVFAPGQVEE